MSPGSSSIPRQPSKMTLLQIMSKTGVSSVRVVEKTYCNLIRGCCRNFQRNLALISVLYSGERPEITPHDEESKKAKTTKLKQKETITMKTKLTKMIMSSLAVACALVCLAAAMAAGHIGYRAGGSRPSLQRGHAKGLVSMDLRRVSKPRWELRTGSRYARPPLQRRWYDAQYLRHGEHRRHDYFRRHRSGRNLYGRTGLHRHPVTLRGPNFQYIRRAGCTAGLDHPERPRWKSPAPRSEQGNGGTRAVVTAATTSNV